MELRITIDENRSTEYHSIFNGTKTITIGIYPIISISIIRPSEINSEGSREKGQWNPNDILGMTKYNLPIFIQELSDIQQSLKLPEMYTYKGEKLELNEELALKTRRVFVIGNVTLELIAVVISQLDETRVEGIKMKFNNEDSKVLLTVNDIESLLYSLKNLDVDNLSLLLYQDFITKPDKIQVYDSTTLNPKIDILPKLDELPAF
jgi:hypothetical protein